LINDNDLTVFEHS